MKKQCPILTLLNTTRPSATDKPNAMAAVLCSEEYCAWWYEHPLTKIKDSGIKGECAILKVAKNTGNIGTR